MPATIVASALNYLNHNGVVVYNFKLCFGQHSTWVVRKSYEDFVELHEVFEKHYDAILLPHLTGPVRPWARNTDATAESRMPKLQSYLNEAIATASLWTPRLYNIAVPVPGGAPGEMLNMNKFLYAFLEVAEHNADPSLEGRPMKSCDIIVMDKVSNSNGAPRERAYGAPGQASPVDATQESAATTLATSQESIEIPFMEGVTDSPPPPRETLEVRLQSVMENRYHRRDLEELALAATVSTITTQIIVNIRDFIIHERDHIEYDLHVSLCGHHWVVTKRFSEFRDLHNSLVGVYGEAAVPCFSRKLAPSWRKLDVKTGEARKRDLNQYLQSVISNVDSWEPQGLLANFELSRRTVRGDQARLTVYVNQILFAFLDFPAHIDALSGDVAAKVVVEHRATMPESVKMAYDRHAQHEKRSRMRERVRHNAERLRPLSDARLRCLMDRVAALQDDRDAVRVFRRLLATGEVEVAGAHLLSDEADGAAGELDGGAIVSPETAAADARGAVVGLTALQLAQLTEALFFNDTKIAAIRLFAGVLIDVDDLQLVFDTLWFHWDKAREEVEQILTMR